MYCGTEMHHRMIHALLFGVRWFPIKKGRCGCKRNVIELNLMIVDYFLGNGKMGPFYSLLFPSFLRPYVIRWGQFLTLQTSFDSCVSFVERVWERERKKESSSWRRTERCSLAAFSVVPLPPPPLPPPSRPLAPSLSWFVVSAAASLSPPPLQRRKRRKKVGNWSKLVQELKLLSLSLSAQRHTHTHTLTAATAKQA